MKQTFKKNWYFYLLDLLPILMVHLISSNDLHLKLSTCTLLVYSFII